MIARREDENLISIDEVIVRAQKLGVDFGSGDPRNRLRYYTKIGLLPYAQRKSFNNNNLPQGAYPADVVELVVEIDRQLKNGKSIQELKRKIKEKQEEKEETLFEKPFTVPLSLDTYYYSEPSPPSFQPPQIEKKIQIEEKSKPHFKLFALLKIAFVILISGTIIFFTETKINIGDLIPSFLAAVSRIEKLAQLTTPSSVSLQEEILVTPPVEPYLTINAETAISGSLDVKESVNSPVFIITKGNFKGLITSTDLTTDQTYTFPNQSGTICLSAGNCIGLGGEVITSGGSPNRIAKFITAQRVGNSSIEDLYTGALITISPVGKVGIGIKNPAYTLQVIGNIQASGDICTDLKGGKCLSQLVETPTIIYGGGGGGGVVVVGGGVSGAGSANYLPIWTAATNLGNSILYQDGANIGIGTTTPSQKLDVAGTIKMIGFQLPTNATSNYVLTSDALGFGTWQPLPGGVLPAGTAGQTLRHNGVNWVADSFLYNTGTAIGIGTTSTLATLTVAGDELINGPLTIATSTLPQLTLKYDDNNYLRFSIDATQTEILSSKTMVINSLTGEIRLGNSVNLFNATSSTVWGRTFISSANDSTVRKIGELVLRSSTPIFRFSIAAQTTSTAFVAVSKEISTTTLNNILPPILPGAARKFTFLLNFADDIPIGASSTWLVDLAAATDTEFYFAGQALASLDEGVPHLSQYINPPEENWQLKVKVPSGNTIRIFNVLLLTYDQIL